VSNPLYEPAEHYDRVSEAWHLLLGEEFHYGVFERDDEPLDRATARLTDLMIEAAQLSPGLSVLDVGCGSGAPACRLAAQFGVAVTGISTSAAGIEQARARAAAEHLPAARFFVRDGMSNGFADESFDRVWVLESAHLMRERQQLIAECTRVLRPGGRLVLCDLMRRREIGFREVRRRRGDFVTLRAAFGDAHFESLDFYVRALRDEGLMVALARDLTAETMPTLDRWRDNARRHADELTDMIGPDGLAAFERSCDLLSEFWRDGTFGYAMVAATKRD
jgi:27-O-demethylrifamycin SV methyltransferase